MKYAKAYVAAVSAALVTAQTAVPMSATAHGWVSVAIAGVGAFLVYRVPNTPSEPK